MRRLLGAAALIGGLAACGPERIPAPPRTLAEEANGQVCGSNGTTYGGEGELGAGVTALYDGPCRRCESDPCGAGEACVKLPCPHREGAELEAPCLQRSGPAFCMPSR